MSSLMEPNFALESRKPYNEKYTRAPGGSIENYSILCANVGFINDNSPGTFSFIPIHILWCPMAASKVRAPEIYSFLCYNRGTLHYCRQIVHHLSI